ncbi:MAG: ABC transporter permease, partial [Deltaproteobacteria bacterium]|nr:ABC transporter permease [Deltaproteobacteria bacterium]
MIGPIWVIADNTFREAIRNKILYILLLVALGLIASSVFFGKLSLDQSVRVVIDFGMGTISFFGVVIAIFIGVNLLYQELDRKTLYTVLVRPIARAQFVLGKYLGMLLTLTVMTVVMSLVLVLLLLANEQTPHLPLLQAIYLSFVELTIVVAVAVFFSAFSTPFLSGAFTFGIFLLGRLKADLFTYLPQLKLGPLAEVLQGVSCLLPNLYRYEVVDRVIYDLPLSSA